MERAQRGALSWPHRSSLKRPLGTLGPQAPTYALKVSVMRAKNLLAKDPNGEWGPAGNLAVPGPGGCGGPGAALGRGLRCLWRLRLQRPLLHAGHPAGLGRPTGARPAQGAAFQLPQRQQAWRPAAGQVYPGHRGQEQHPEPRLEGKLLLVSPFLQPGSGGGSGDTGGCYARTRAVSVPAPAIRGRASRERHCLRERCWPQWPHGQDSRPASLRSWSF